MSCRKEESKGGGEEDDDGVILCSSSSRRGNDGIHLQQKEEEEDEILVGGGRKRNRMTKAKHLLLLPLKNFQKLHFTKKKHRRRPDPPPPPPPPPLPPFPYAEEGLKGCYLCFMPPRIPASASSPLPSTIQKKPSSSYYDFVKSLIEENDFYSPECNVHRDLMSPERK